MRPDVPGMKRQRGRAGKWGLRTRRHFSQDVSCPQPLAGAAPRFAALPVYIARFGLPSPGRSARTATTHIVSCGFT